MQLSMNALPAALISKNGRELLVKKGDTILVDFPDAKPYFTEAISPLEVNSTWTLFWPLNNVSVRLLKTAAQLIKCKKNKKREINDKLRIIF